MKKIFGIFSFVLLGLLFTSCNNSVSFKKYKEEVKSIDFQKALAEKMKDYENSSNEEYDFVVEMNITAKTNSATTYKASEKGYEESSNVLLSIDVEYDADNKACEINGETKIEAKTPVGTTSNEAKKQIFAQQDEASTYMIDLDTRTYEKSSESVKDFTNDSYAMYLQLALSMLEDDENAKFYVDDNIFTIVVKKEAALEEDDEIDACVQYIFSDKGVEILMESKTVETSKDRNENTTVETVDTTMSMKLALKNVNVKPKNLDDFLLLNDNGGLL